MKRVRTHRFVAFLILSAMILSMTAILAVAEEPVSYFEDFDGRSRAEMVSGTPAVTARVTAEEGHGDVLRIDVKPVPVAAYFLYVNKDKKWVLTSYTVNADGTVSGTASNNLTVTNARVNYENLDKSTAFTYPDSKEKYYVVTGEYVDAIVGAKNVAAPTAISIPAFPFVKGKNVVIEADIFLSADFSAESGVSSRIRSSFGNLELFEIKSSKTATVFSCHENGTNILGGGRAISLGEWHHFAIEIDMQSALRTVYLDGEFLALQSNIKNPIATEGITLLQNGLQFQIDRGSAPSTFAGYVAYDNLSMYYTDGEGFGIYRNDFEGETEGSEPASGISSLSVKNSTVKSNYGSKAWNVPIIDENVNKNPTVKNQALSYLNFDAVVFETDLFIPTGTYGKLQSQVRNPTALVGEGATEETTIANGWIDIFTVVMGEGKTPYLTIEKDVSTVYAQIENDRWNRISVAIDLQNGSRTLYLNGDEVLKTQIYLDATCRNVTILANSWIVAGKINKNQPLYTGDVQLDNLSIFSGRIPSLTPESSRALGFEEFAYIAEKGELPRLALSATPASLSLTESEGNYALRMTAEAGEGTALKRVHPTYSYESCDRVAFSASYYLEEGAVGRLAAVLDAYTSGETLVPERAFFFAVDAATGRMEDALLSLKRAAWNEITVLLTLSTGAYDVFVDGVWARSGSVGALELTVGDSTETELGVVYTAQEESADAPGVLVDDLLVTDWSGEDCTVDPHFLTDAVLEDWMDGILTMVDHASVRMDAPAGLRFVAAIDEEKLAYLEAVFGASVLSGGGIVIAPADYVRYAGGFTKEALEALPLDVKYLDVAYRGERFDGEKVGLARGAYVSGSIVELREENISREFAASAYLSFSFGETVYTVTTKSATVQSLKDVAAKALADGDWSAEEEKILSAYANGALPKQ